MDAREFLSRTVGDDGQYCLFAIRSNGRLVQNFFPNIDALVEDAKYMDDNGADTYFALATYKDNSSRTVDNALQLRAFFLDLDCGEGKPFEDQQEAFNALKDFCKRLELPRPSIVNSGRGLHIYWQLTTPISVAEWVPRAKALQATCKQHGFGADPAVTTDAARILRIPGTHNHKRDEPEPVELLHSAEPVELSALENAIGGEVDVLAAGPQFAVPEGMSAMQERLIGNKESSFKRIVEMSDDDRGCPQLAHMLQFPEEVDEPLWRAGLSIAQHCRDHERAIHVLSEGHPEYDFDATEEKARLTKGPYTCEKFDAYNPGVCQDCPHWGKIKSPIVLGQEIKQAKAEDDGSYTIQEEDQVSKVVKTYVVPPLPKPYVRGANGGVYKIEVNDDGEREDKLVYHHDFYVVRRVDDEAGGGDHLVLRLHLPRDGVREFTVAQSALYAPTDMKQALAARGIVCRTAAAWTILGEYIMDWINELQNRTTADTANRQFGWTEDMKSFVIGDREYVPGSILNNPATTATQPYFKFFRPKGTIEEWKGLVNIYNQPGMEVYQLLVAAGFGAPIMAFSAINGFVIHLDADTGYGKTTAQYAATSIWGCPQELGMEDQDTLYSKMNRLEVFKNIFCMFDEMTNTTPEKLSEVAYTVSSGRQRNRMSGSSNQERPRGAPWATIVTTSGNMSYHARLDSIKSDASAEKERVFEIHMDSYAKAGDKAETDRFQKAIKHECYGVAGDLFIQYVMDNMEDVERLFHGVQAKLDKAASLDNRQRFKSAGFAAILTGGTIAQRLGLIDYDMANLFKYIVKLLEEAKETAVETKKTPDELLIDFITEHWNDVLRIRNTKDTRKSDGAAEVVIPDSVPRGKLVARYETDTHNLYIVPKYFNQWCVKQQLNPTGVLDALGQTYPVTRNVQVRLAKGTSMDIPPTKCTRIIMELNIADEADTDAGADSA